MLGLRLLGIALRAVIEVRIGWSNLSSLGKAATIVFICEASAVLSPFIPPPLTELLFIIDRLQTVGHLAAIDIAYVTFSLLGNIWTITSCLWLVRRFARFYMHRRWLESFEPDWPDEKSKFWKMYFSVGRVGYRVLQWVVRKWTGWGRIKQSRSWLGEETRSDEGQ